MNPKLWARAEPAHIRTYFTVAERLPSKWRKQAWLLKNQNGARPQGWKIVSFRPKEFFQ
jgi:hypothetical protein